MVRIASFNVENLFARPKAFNTADWSLGEPILDAYRKVNALFAHDPYSDADKQEILDLLVQLDIYTVNSHGAIRRKETLSPRWAWLRKNRGKFDREPNDDNKASRLLPPAVQTGLAGSSWPRSPSMRPVQG